MANGLSWLKTATLVVSIMAAAIPGIGTWYVMGWRLDALENDKRDFQALEEADNRLGKRVSEESDKLDKRIDEVRESVRAQWSRIADTKDRITRLEERVNTLSEGIHRVEERVDRSGRDR